MISVPRRSASSTIARPACRARTTRSTPRTPYGPGAPPAPDRPHAVRLRDGVRHVEELVGLLHLLAQIGVEGQLERDGDHAQEDDAAGALRRQPGRDLDRLPGLAAGDDRDEDR